VGLGVIIEAAAPLLSTRWGGDVPLHEEHLPERFGLFTILVLGEAVGSVMFGLRGTDWQLPSVSVAALGFVIAAALWWSYFDVGGARGREELTEDDSNAPDPRHDRYIFGHLPVLIGLAAAAWPWPWLAVPLPLLAVLLPTPLLSVAAVAAVLLVTLAEGLREKHTGTLHPTSA
jgi:low temperature requirement protein LtrA